MMRKKASFTSLALTLLLLLGLRLLGGSDPLAGATQRLLTVFASHPQAALTAEETPELTLVVAENERLKEQLALAPAENLTYIGATVVSKSSGTYRSSIRINRGREDGLVGNMPVMGNGYLIGVVSEVYEKQSVVILARDPDFRAAATIEGTNFLGIVTNNSGGTILDKISSKEADLAGSVVVTNGLGGLYYPGLPLGRVGTEISEDDDVLRSFVLRTFSLNEDLREVLVITNHE